MVCVCVCAQKKQWQYTCWWEGVLYKDEDGLLSAELDPLPYHIDKLSNREVGRNEVPVCSRVSGTIHLDDIRKVHYSWSWLILIS
jgi:hypothetical protein